MARVGFMPGGAADAPESRPLLEILKSSLRTLGWVEGRNLVIEARGADGRIDRFPEIAAELVRLKVDVIVAPSTPAARAARQATATIPIVATAMGDPVGDGLVASLGHPGGNVTGLTFLGPELVAKRLQLLKEALPRLSRVGGLWQPGAFSEATTREMLQGTEAAARALGVQLHLAAAGEPREIEPAFAALVKERPDAVIVFASTMLYAERRRLVRLAARHGVPSMFNTRESVDDGALIAYGASLPDLTRQGARYVDQILKGARPADLPVQQADRFELAVNLKTAAALRLTLPADLVRRADHVVR